MQRKGGCLRMTGSLVSHYRIPDKFVGGDKGVLCKPAVINFKCTVASKFLPEKLSLARQALEWFQRELERKGQYV
jgi:hypothetical protein